MQCIEGTCHTCIGGWCFSVLQAFWELTTILHILMSWKLDLGVSGDSPKAVGKWSAIVRLSINNLERLVIFLYLVEAKTIDIIWSSMCTYLMCSSRVPLISPPMCHKDHSRQWKGERYDSLDIFDI